MTLDDLLSGLFGGGNPAPGGDMSPGAMVQQTLAGGMPPAAPRRAPQPLPSISMAGGPREAPVSQDATPAPQTAPSVAPPVSSVPEPTVNPLASFSRGYRSGGLVGAFGNLSEEQNALARASAEKRNAAADTQRKQTLTYNALIKKGLDDTTALAVVANPEIMKVVIPQLFGTKDADKAPPVVEVFDETTGQPRKMQWNPGAGKYEPMGGVKAGGGGVGGGFESVKQRADVEEGLRKEVFTTNKDYMVIRDAAAKVEAIAQQPSAASDVALIYSFMKILDPGSVVRETEYATAQNAAGVPDQIRNVFNRILSGERLGDVQRNDFLNQARTLAKTQAGQYEKALKQYQGVAERLGVDPRNVILDQPGQDQGGSPAAPAGMPQPGSVMDGYRFRGGDPADRNNWEPAQ